MAISYVGSGTASSANSNGGTSTISVTLPTIQANDFALLFLSKGNTESLTTNPTASGFTLLDENTNSTTNHSFVWYKKLVGNETTLTATWTTAAYNAMGVVVYRGVDETSPFDTTYQVSAFTTNDAAPDFPAITTVSVGAEVVYVANAIKNTSTSAAVTWTAPAGTSDAVQDSGTRNNSLNATVFSSHKNQASAGTVATTSGTVTLNVDYWGYTVALNQKKILVATGIASAEAIGTPVSSVGPITTIPTAIASDEAFGTITGNSTVTLTATGIASAGAVGTPVTLLKSTHIPTGIASAQALGTPVAQIGYPQTAVATGIASAGAVGTPVAIYSNVMYPPSVASAQAFGTPTGRSTVTLTGIGIASAGVVPTPVLGAPIRLTAVGIDDSAIGAVGTPTMLPGPVNLVATGIATASVVPSPVLAQVEEAWGILQLI